MGNFRNISNRILFVVGFIVAIGLIAIAILFGARQEQAIQTQNERALLKVTESVGEALQSIMLRGYAGIAGDFAGRLKEVEDVADFRVMRADGRQAFVDNSTIEAVNAHLGEVKFEAHPNAPAQAPQVLEAGDPRLARVLQSAIALVHYDRLESGERQVTVLQPVLRGSGNSTCRRCHADGEELRGVIKLTTSLAAVDADIRRSWWQVALAMLIGAGGIAAAVYTIANRAVAQPIRKVTRAMGQAAGGDLSVSVAVRGRDEIGRMAESFNEMSRELLRAHTGLQDQQNKLTTVILSARDGIVVTNPAGDVVLVNPATCDLLGKTEAQVITGGFLGLVDDPAWMQARMAAKADGPPEAAVIRRNGRELSITASTIRDDAGAPIGSAAIIRDVTDELRFELELKKRAATDVLTGLHNRRHFDEHLAHEFARWQRYQSPLALLMLDVDHFKRFNDTHGHDCGDRVLQAIGKLLCNLPPDPGATACRYGGEELAVVMSGTVEAEVKAAAENIRTAVSALRIDGLQVTVSIGVVTCPPLSPASRQALLKLADTALYRAKADGRNCVRFSEAGRRGTGKDKT